jgi:hypothetical protein
MIRALLVCVTLLVAAPAVASAAPALVAQRTGGIAGVQDRLVVRADGSATVTHRDGGARRLGAARTRAVRTALRAARFPTLAPLYQPEGVVNDGFTYVLRAGGRTVRVDQGAEHVPARLQRLISAVSALLTS